MHIPTEAEFKSAVHEYRKRESRGAVYFVALKRISEGWGDSDVVADGIGLLLKSWHNVFYRFGLYDPNRLSACIEANTELLAPFRNRTIDTLSSDDEPSVRTLFDAFTEALKGGRNGSQESTVATAKALHLLAPAILPLWDNPIAGAYGQFPMWSRNYIGFCWQMKELAAALRPYLPEQDDCTALKRIDEFNYAVYTQNWIRIEGVS